MKKITDELLDLDILHKKAVPIYKKASQIALENFDKGHLNYEIKTEEKVTSIVTDVDKKINEMLTNDLKKLIPGSGVFSEEGERKLSGKHNWVIDPIDGTGNYQKSVDLWGTAISLWDQTWTVYATLLYPTSMNKMYYGVLGKGVYDENDHKLQMQKTGIFKIMFSIDTPNQALKSSLLSLDFEHKTSYKSTGSTVYDGYNILKGGYDFMVTYDLDIYDVDAIHFLAKELGYVVDLMGNETTLYSNNLRNSTFKSLIAKPDVYDIVAPKIKKCIKEYEDSKSNK